MSIYYIASANDFYTWQQNLATYPTGKLITNVSINATTWARPPAMGATNVFDGQGYTITLTGGSQNFQSLFNMKNANCIVKNVTVNCGGSWVAQNEGILTPGNSLGIIQYVKMTNIYLFNPAGTFCGYNSTMTLQYCQAGEYNNYVTIRNPGAPQQAGGFAGYGFSGSFEYCVAYVFNDCIGSGGFYTGEWNSVVTIDNCRSYFYNPNPRRSAAFVGGGTQGTQGSSQLGRCTIRNSYSIVSMDSNQGTSNYNAGFVGEIRGGDLITIENSYVLSDPDINSHNPSWNLYTFYRPICLRNFTNASSLILNNVAMPFVINYPNTNEVLPNTSTNINTGYTSSTSYFGSPINAFSITNWDMNIAPPYLATFNTSNFSSSSSPITYSSPQDIVPPVSSVLQMTWNTPSDMVYGQPLSSTQLNPTVMNTETMQDVTSEGTVTYYFNGSPVFSGYVFSTVGSKTLSVIFIPNDSTLNVVGANVTFNYNKFTPVLTQWPANQTIIYGNTFLPALAVDYNGDVITDSSTFYSYTINPGSILNPNVYVNNCNFTPPSNLSGFYNSTSGVSNIIVIKRNAVINWTPSTPIYYPTILSNAQLNATSSTGAGAMSYELNPSGTRYTPGTYTLLAHFEPGGTNRNLTNPTDVSETLTVLAPPSGSTNINETSGLYNWLQNQPNNTGVLQADISIGSEFWTLPNTALYEGSILDGNGRTITIFGQGNINWPGFVNLLGGTIKNLTLDVSGLYLQPTGSSFLVANQNSSGTIQGVKMIGSPIINSDRSGGIVGQNSSCLISYCQIGTESTPVIITNTDAGGMTGLNFSGQINNSISYINIQDTSNPTTNSGGLCGSLNGGLIERCIVSGNIQATSCGGMIGSLDGDAKIENSYSYVSISDSTSSGMCGNVGSYSLTVNNSYYINSTNVPQSGIANISSSTGNVKTNNVASSVPFILSSANGYVDNMNIKPFIVSAPVFTGVNGNVNVIKYHSGNYYIGGNFTTVNGESISNITFYDGTSFYSMNTGLESPVNDLWIISSSEIYVATDALGSTAPYQCVFKWDGTSWTPVEQTGGVGTNGNAKTIVYSTPYLFVGGDFTNFEGASYIAQCDITQPISWTSLPSTIGDIKPNGPIYKIALDAVNNEIIIGGNFTNISNASPYYANSIFKYDLYNTSPSVFGTSGATNNGVNGYVYTIYVGTELYIGGTFTIGYNGGTNTNLYKMGYWNNGWFHMNTTPLDGDVYSILQNGNDFYIGGSFQNVEGIYSPHLSKWDGNSTWSSPTTYVNNTVKTIVIQNNMFYAGGLFTGIEGDYSTILNGLLSINLTNNIEDYTTTFNNQDAPINQFQ